MKTVLKSRVQDFVLRCQTRDGNGRSWSVIGRSLVGQRPLIDTVMTVTVAIPRPDRKFSPYVLISCHIFSLRKKSAITVKDLQSCDLTNNIAYKSVTCGGKYSKFIHSFF